MKKLLPVLILLLALLAAVPALADTTLMMYMCGSDLQDDCLRDIREICKAGTGENVHVVILAGGAEKWNDRRIVSGRLNLFRVENGDLVSLGDMGGGSMGDPATLTAFVTRAEELYPADRTMLVLWNHGGGSYEGVCYDACHDFDPLTLSELSSALAQLKKADPGFRLDILGMDACLMACYEAAVTAEPYAEYMIASEELEPAIGWAYTDWLKTLENDPSVGSEELLKGIAAAYETACMRNDPDDYVTLSAVRLSGIPALTGFMEQLGGCLSQALEQGELRTINRMHQRMDRYGNFAHDATDMVDLGSLLDICAQYDPQGTEQARAALKAALVVNYASPNVPVASGLSVFMPLSERAGIAKIIGGMGLADILPNYTAFIRGYAERMNGSEYTFAASSVSHTDSYGMQNDPSFSSFFSSFQSGMYGMIPAGQAPSFIAGSAGGSAGTSAQTPSGQAPSWIAGTAGGTQTAGPAATPAPSGIPGFIAGNPQAYTEPPQLTESSQAFTASLTADAMDNLSYAEGMLMMDLSDESGMFLVDLGYLRNSWIDWENNAVCSMFDGTWPTLEGQLVAMYDQSVTERSRRSLIPVTVNGNETYLVVVFDSGSATGRIAGCNEGYDEHGLPVRGMRQLEDGDIIVPEYTLYYSLYEDDGEPEEAVFFGDEIVWHDGMTVTYESLRDDEDPDVYQFSFVLNDIFGDCETTDPIGFTL